MYETLPYNTLQILIWFQHSLIPTIGILILLLTMKMYEQKPKYIGLIFSELPVNLKKLQVLPTYCKPGFKEYLVVKQCYEIPKFIS